MVCHALTARFHEVDRAGVVFFGRYFEYAHIAFEEFLDRAFAPDRDVSKGAAGDAEAAITGTDGAAVFERLGFGMPLVNATADYRRPTRGGDRLVVETAVERFTERSITFAHTVRGADDAADVRAVVRLKHAFVHLPAFTPARRPEPLVAALDRLGLRPPKET